MGILLLLVGLAFLVLLAALKHGEQLAGDLKVSAFMLCVAAILIWTGSRFLKPSPESLPIKRQDNLGPHLLRLRPAAELMAALGCLLLLCRIVSTFAGFLWPPEPLFVGLLAGPVVIGLFALRILVPGAFQSSVFPSGLVKTWSKNTRRLVNLVLQAGWLGYFAIPLAWCGLDAHIPGPWGRVLQLVACLLISVLYASQTLVLHLGDMRNSEDSEQRS
jgi:hypothetical protein